MAIYIEYEGIEGNATAAGFEKHFKVESFSFSVGRGISMESGNMSNRETTRPSLSEIVFTKVADNSCTALFKEAVTGSAGKKVTVKFVRTGTDNVTEYMSYELENCLVSNYSLSGSAEGEPIETVCVSYAKLSVNYLDHDKTNAAGSPQRVGYDLETAKPL